VKATLLITLIHSEVIKYSVYDILITHNDLIEGDFKKKRKEEELMITFLSIGRVFLHFNSSIL
jgi:hypothetical protein